MHQALSDLGGIGNHMHMLRYLVCAPTVAIAHVLVLLLLMLPLLLLLACGVVLDLVDDVVQTTVCGHQPFSNIWPDRKPSLQTYMGQTLGHWGWRVVELQTLHMLAPSVLTMIMAIKATVLVTTTA